ncbi:carbonic anhydrase 14-like [Haliotis rufescens]|uniref:carbonic anhydrase 14-like n=1 Tax=Haliotis rufescens TaxID=6454 RepID=UPI001EB04BBF|nr:carbonic anhydrase 14-like [Haliotis rufescens]
MGSAIITCVEILLFVVFCTDFTRCSEWSYKGDTGPGHWHDLFPEACSGNLQSPININPEETVYNPNLREFAIWYDPPKDNAQMFVKNNGHAVQVDTLGDFFVTNGGLPYVYKTAQFHFHWGHKNHQGSEHRIEGQAHPLELHIVNFNSDLFGTIAEAVSEPMGLAVLGVLFEIVDEDNEVLKPILEAMEEVKDPDDDNLVEIKAIALRDLLPADTAQYFRYNGSLTTPGCFESVMWTVFRQRQKISLDQLLKFRKVLKPKHKKHAHKHKHQRRHIKRSSAEKNAETVLDELGIHGNHMAEDELKADMAVKLAASTKAPVDEMTAAALVDATTEPSPTESAAELDEDSAKRAQDNMVRHVMEKEAEDKQAHEEHMAEIQEYIQEELADNFRPIQPLNGRLIERSFKLSVQQVFVATNGGPNPPSYNIPENNSHRGHSVESKSQGSGAGLAGLSFITVLASVLALLMC